MFYHKAAVMGALVLKLRFQCLIETVVSIKHLGLYAPLRIPFKRKRLPMVKLWNCQSKNNCILKKWGNSKNCSGIA